MFNPFKWAAKVIKSIKTPDWLVDLLQALQDITKQILITVGKAYMEDVKNKIIEVSSKNISPTEKFTEVFKYARININVDKLKDRYLKKLIEDLVNKLKDEGSI